MIASGQSVPVLLVPTGCGLVVLPSAMVCEVVRNSRIFPVPGTREWVLGYFIWRRVPVSVCSFEGLVGHSEPAGEVRKLVVLYPLSGRPRHEYFAIASNAEPRTTSVGVDVQVGSSTVLTSRFVSSVVELPAGTGLIPDFQALKAAFYPE